MHVFPRSVSGNGSRSKIKKERGVERRERGVALEEEKKRENDETVGPPHPGKNAMYGTW